MLARAVTIACVFALTLTASAGPSRARSVTECTKDHVCYCVDQDLKVEIQKKVAEIRARIAAERAQGKAIGYLSIPISSAGGGYNKVNGQVAKETADRVVTRLGARAAWVLNTASDEVKLSGDARGPEYMLMWTQVLEGEDGLGRHFDFVYFVGPSEFAKFFGLKGANDLEILEAYYDRESPADPKLRQIDKREFRNYYGLRASVAASRGSHDEWNIVRLINERRRHEQHRAEFGMARQLAVLFDGQALAPGPVETVTAPGYLGVARRWHDAGVAVLSGSLTLAGFQRVPNSMTGSGQNRKARREHKISAPPSVSRHQTDVPEVGLVPTAAVSNRSKATP